MAEPSAFRTLALRGQVALLWMRRETGRLAAWTGFEVWMVVLLLGIATSAAAMGITMVGAEAEVHLSTVALAGGIGLALGGASAVFLAPLAGSTAVESQLDAERQLLAAMQSDHAAMRERRRAEREAAAEADRRERALRREAEMAEEARRSAAEVQRQQAARLRSEATRKSAAHGAARGQARCWYCRQAVSGRYAQCPYCRAVLAREVV